MHLMTTAHGVSLTAGRDWLTVMLRFSDTDAVVCDG